MEWFGADPARKEQILAAALDLLATTPIDGLTTRAIADAVGVSQPAIFRHFRSRQEILVGIAERARMAVEGQVVDLLSPGAPVDRSPLDDCAALARILVAHVARYPGLPRLLCADLDPDQPELRAAIGRLVTMQRSLVAERVAEAVRRKLARPGCDAGAAADLFVAMLRGLPISARVAGVPPEQWPDRLEPQLQLWLAALSPVATAQAVALPPAAEPAQLGLRALDVRPILGHGRDPLADILAVLDTLSPGALLAVTAPFRPRPLEALLANKGHGVTVVDGEAGVFTVLVGVGGPVALVDLRDLEPPEPLQRAVAIGRALGPGQGVFVHTPRNPRWLAPQLDAVGCHCTVAELADGSAVVHVRRAA